MSNNKIAIWWWALRPKTLIISVMPVYLGTAMAFGDGLHHWPSAFLALAGAVLFQCLTNVLNDYYDFICGTDTYERKAPLSIIQQGLLTKTEIKVGVGIILFLLAAVCYALILRGGTPILLIAIFSAISAIIYTAGPFPLAYYGLGEIFVLLFFGPIAVGGTYYVQALEINPAVVISGLGPGLLAVAVLVVNNIRDIETDRKANKQTLAVRFGRIFAMYEYIFCLMGASLVPVLVYAITADYIFALLAVFVLFLSAPLIYRIATQDGELLNPVLASTAQLVPVYCFLYSLGWLVHL